MPYSLLMAMTDIPSIYLMYIYMRVIKSICRVHFRIVMPEIIIYMRL